jgi:steroid delta-isomerase-like uncharacterized protein
MSSQNEAIARSVLNNWNEGNPTVWDDLCTSDFVHHGREDRDLEGFKQTYEGLRHAFPDGHFTVEDMIAEGDRVAVRYTFAGTHEGAYLGIQPTDKGVSLSGMIVWRIVGNRIAESWMFFDRAGLFEQIGAPHSTGDSE